MMKTTRRLVFVLSVLFIGALPLHADGVDDFVNRMYTVVFQRDADTSGFEDWTSRLRSGQASGTGIVFGFFMSAEYAAVGGRDNDATGRDKFVTDCYSALFDREPDEGGKADWLNQLSTGVLHEDVVWGFVRSQEFADLCARFGIVQLSDDDTTEFSIRSFVRRTYQSVLNREPDAGGISNWVASLQAGTFGGADILNLFLWSTEFVNRNVTDNDYIDIHYQAMFGRAPDTEGQTNWRTQFSNGTISKRGITQGFAGSQEWNNFTNQFGINPGSTATGEVISVSGNLADDGTVVSGTRLLMYDGNGTALFDERLTNTAGDFSFNCAPGQSVDQYQLVVEGVNP